MKNKTNSLNLSCSPECLIPNEEIKKRTEELVREYEEKLERRQARLNAVANGFKAVFSPR